MTTINIAGIDKATLLAALVNQGTPLGLGVLQAREMTVQEAQEWIDRGYRHDFDFTEKRRRNEVGHLMFDYVHGVPVKSNLTGDEVNPDLYDRDQGDGAFERVVTGLRQNPSREVML